MNPLYRFLKNTPNLNSLGLLIFICIFSLSAQAESWKFSALQQMALERNLKIKAGAQRLESAKSTVTLDYLTFLPKVNASLGYTDYQKVASTLTYAEPQPYKIYSYAVSARWTVFDGGRQFFQLRQDQANVKIKKSQLNKTQKDIIKNLKKAYFQALESEASIYFAHKNLAIQKSLFEIAQRKQDAGLMTASRVIDQQIQLGVAQNQLDSYRDRFLQAKETLSSLIGVESEFWDKHSFITLDESSIPEEYKLNNPKNKSTSQSSPSLKDAQSEILKAQLSAAEHSESQQYSNFLPNLTLNADFGHDENRWWSNSAGARNYSVGFTATWGLHSFIQGFAQVSSKSSLTQASQLDLEDRQYELSMERSNKKQQIKSYSKKLMALLTKSDLLSQKLSQSELELQAGKISKSEFLQNEIQFNKTFIEFFECYAQLETLK